MKIQATILPIGIVSKRSQWSKVKWLRLELSLRVNNVLDATYATPGGVEHRQAAITQDGRNLSVELRYRF